MYELGLSRTKLQQSIHRLFNYCHVCGCQATPFTVPEKLSCCNVGDTQTQQTLFIQQIYPWLLFSPQHKPWEWITAKQNVVPGMTPVKILDQACSCLASMNDSRTVSRTKSPERRSTVFPLTKSTWCQRNTCCWLQNRQRGSSYQGLQVYRYCCDVFTTAINTAIRRWKSSASTLLSSMRLTTSLAVTILGS